jgi:hypothetical protein
MNLLILKAMTTRKYYHWSRYLLWGILGLGAIAAFGFVIMWLWNWLVPALFSGPVITYWQTIGLLILSKILFSGIGHGRSWHHYDRGYKEYWRKRCEEQMNSRSEGMTAESV